MCAKFHFNCIYLKNSMEGGPFPAPRALERPKKPSINRVKHLILTDYYSILQIK